jgi:hypothetical protein
MFVRIAVVVHGNLFLHGWRNISSFADARKKKI